MIFFRNFIYLVLIFLALPFLLWRAVMQGKYRDGFREKFFGEVPSEQAILPGAKPVIKLWFHAVSVGEVMLLRPLLALIRCRHPEWECVISTTSRAGMELAQRLFREDHLVFYCPLDFSWSVRRALARVNPAAIILAEQELWPNLIALAKKRGVSVMIINGRFSVGGFRRYRFGRFLFQTMMRQLDCVAAQSETYADCFADLGTPRERISVTGSMKFDGAQTDRNNPASERMRKLAGITESDIVFLAGSTQYPEETFALDAYLSLRAQFPQLRLILVPRHPQRFDEVAAMLDARGVLWMRRTALDENLPADSPVENLHSARARILLVDTVGELGAWWGTAHIAFVGGSIHKRGGQNMIEPAAYGAAVSFGPNTSNFRDIVSMMLDAGAAMVVHNAQEMETFVRRMLEDSTLRQSLGTRAQSLVLAQRGATEKTLALIESVVKKN